MDISQGKKKLVSQVLWTLSNLPVLRYPIDQCLIPMGFILRSKRVIENIEVNSQLIILEDGIHIDTHIICTHISYLTLYLCTLRECLLLGTLS